MRWFVVRRPQYHRFMVSCSILTRSLWYLLGDSFEIEIKRGRLGRREKGTKSSVLIGVRLMESGSMPGQSLGA